MNTFQSIVIPIATLLAIRQLGNWWRQGPYISLLKAAVWGAFAGCVYRPDAVQLLAQWAKIGRGADLLLYMLVVFVLMATFRFIHELENQRQEITELTRELAKRDAKFP